MSAAHYIPLEIGRMIAAGRPLSQVDSGVALYLIGASDLDAAWGEAAPLLAKSLVSGRLGVMGRLDCDDLLEALRGGEMQMFCIREVSTLETGRMLGAMVTECMTYPKKKVLSLAFMGGVEMHRWVDRILDLELWARENGFEQVEIPGRKGWGRLLAALGYVPITYTAAKEL